MSAQNEKLNEINQFGKDHWSLLAYVEYRAINHNGRLDKNHLRIKEAILRNSLSQNNWKPEDGTRLFGYWNKDGTMNPKLLLPNHDDLDCLNDLEEVGLIKSIGTGLNPAYHLTELGVKVVGKLTLWKQEGKNYSNFIYKIEK